MLEDIFKRVKNLLKQKNEYRSSDHALICRIWYEDIKNKIGVDVNSLSFYDFLTFVKNKNITNWDTITRARRKVQEEYPDLRDADTYKKRQNLQSKWIKGIRNATTFKDVSDKMYK